MWLKDLLSGPRRAPEVTRTIGDVSPRVSRKMVGYWEEKRDLGPPSRLPHPAKLVDRSWRAEQRDEIIAYLRQGNVLSVYGGFSYCRFEGCGVSGIEMGTCDLTDGEWVWPQGLPHYVEAHDVRLPDQFVQTMETNCFRVPPLNISPDNFDGSFWQKWSEENTAVSE